MRGDDPNLEGTMSLQRAVLERAGARYTSRCLRGQNKWHTALSGDVCEGLSRKGAEFDRGLALF